ncbi:MAG: SRPBCC domain-containing protein [Solirubrobacterales bacterium]
MDEISVKREIGASRAHIFEILLDLSARPSFTDHFMDEFHVERIPPSGVGAAARFQTGPRRNRMWMETVITEAEPHARVVEQGKGGRSDRIPTFTTWTLQTLGDERTEVRVTFRTEPGLRSDRMKERGTSGWYRRRWKRALGRLQEVSESQAAPERIRVAGGDRVPVT